MAKIVLAPRKFIGASTDDKPTGIEVPIGSTFFEHDTHTMYITYDSTNWAVKEPGGVVKTIQTELLAITKVAADGQQKSSVLALVDVKKVAILIDHGRTATTAFVVAGTEYRVEVSEKATGDDTWRTVASAVCGIATASEITAAGAEAAGQTLIACGDPEPAVNDVVFWENATLGNSEWGKVVARVDNTSFTLQDGLTNAQATAKKIYNKGEHFVLLLDVEAYTRLRVIVNNNNGTTNAQVASRVAAITRV